MPRPKVFKLGRLTQIMRIRGVDVYVHWSVFLIVAIMLAGTLRRPVLTIVGLISYLSLILIHECGHMIVAQRLRCRVWAIKLYPIHGLCIFDIPWSRFDHCLIAWGGVLAQAVVALPLVIWVALFGYTPFDAVNAVMAILGFYSVCVAVFNLIPRAPLDGALAWQVIPLFIQRVKARRKKRSTKRTTDWRSY